MVVNTQFNGEILDLNLTSSEDLFFFVSIYQLLRNDL